MDPTSQPSYPVQIQVELPGRFSRAQLALRILVFAAFGVVHQSAVGLFGMLYVLLPLVAAILVTHRTGSGYLQRDAPFVVSVLEWVLGLYAYLLFVTDAFPLSPQDRALRLQVRSGGSPTVASALLRLFASLPHLAALALIGLAAFVIGFIAAVAVLLDERYPLALQEFQRDVVAWIARVFAYHASLVEEYPAFSFERTPSSPTTGPESDEARA